MLLSCSADLFLSGAEEAAFSHPVDLLMRLLWFVEEMEYEGFNKGPEMFGCSSMKL